MSRSNCFLVSLAAVLACGGLMTTTALGEPLLRLDDFEPGELVVRGFELRQAGKIDIEAVGVRPRWENELAAYSWILDAKTREPVWVMEAHDSDRVPGQSLLRKVERTLDLPAGRYELYAWAPSLYGDYGHSYRIFGFRFEDNRSWGRDSRRLEMVLEDCYVTLTSKSLKSADFVAFEPTGEIPGTLLRSAGLGQDESVRTGFRLDQPGEIEIYAFTELPDEWDVGADTGWIENATTHERVFKLDHRNTEPAGGAEKNRVCRDSVKLDKGDYVLVYGTDDSHAYPEWNAAPPFDPLNYGITLLPGKGFVASTFHVVETLPQREPLVDLTRARDDDALEQAFRLSRDSEVWIHAIGEYSHNDGEFADYGWIQKAGSSEIVWEMTEDNTDHAGGADKNREFNGSVRLPAGDYVATFVTDGSHAYHSWNSSPPFDRDAWGLAIYPGPGFEAANFKKLESVELAQNSNVLVRITRVGDRERLRERFTLSKSTKVHIYALGEASDGEMFDYGYIENAKSGDVVWEMTVRNTRHAGGARKNRIFDGEITLEAGTYEVFYETDGSHAFGDWNAARPRDPRSWGITVSMGAGR